MTGGASYRKGIMDIKEVIKKANPGSVMLKVLYCAVVFIASLFILSAIMNRGNTDMTAVMEEPSFPDIVFVKNGLEYNRMHGYSQDMDIAMMQGTVTPLSDDRLLDIYVRKYGNTIKSINFTVRNIADGRLIENSAVTEYHENEEGIRADLMLKDLLEEGREYSLMVTLVGEDGREFDYYTTIIKRADLSEAEKLDFVYSFHKSTYSRNEAEEKLAKYMESDETGDNTTLSRVDLHSSLDQLAWGVLKPEEIISPVAYINEIDEETADIRLEYAVRIADIEHNPELFVSEKYRIRLGGERIYLLDYVRECEQIFKPGISVIAGNKIVLGITDREVVMAENNDGSDLAFVNAGRLFVYDSSDDSLAYVFGSHDGDISDRRETERENGIRICSVDETGNVRFIVYGYMNRGKHEGSMGTAVYYYDNVLNTVMEEVFIPYDGAFPCLAENIKRQVYAGSDGFVCSYRDGSFLKTVLDSNVTEVLAEGLSETEFRASKDGSMAAWVEAGNAYDAGEMHILNMVTGRSTDVKSEKGEYIRPVGFFGNDVIYGIARAGDIYEDKSGRTVFPMYCLRIKGEDGSIKKEYREENIYVTGIEEGSGMYRLKRVKLTGSRFEEIEDDRLMDNSTPVYGKNTVAPVVTDVYETVIQIALKRNVSIDKLQYPEPKFVIFEGNRTAEQKKNEAGRQGFYVFKSGAVSGHYDILADAVEKSINEGGVVRDPAGRAVYMKTQLIAKNQIMAIEAPGRAAEGASYTADDCIRRVAAFEGIRQKGDANSMSDKKEVLAEFKESLPEYEILDLSGCSMEAVFYYLAMDIPVIALKNNAYVLLTGYNDTEIVVYDPLDGSLSKKSRQVLNEEFEDSGNIFFTYLR